MSNPKISFTCTLYDRIQPLYYGDVKVEGFDLDFEGSYGWESVRRIFDRNGAGKGADVSEMSTSEYISSVAAGTCKHVAIPVFPSRAFRSGYTFVNAGRIRKPKDLEGKRIGVPLYTMTAAVFARGHLADEYGVDFDTVEWVQGAMNEAAPHGNPTVPPLLRPTRIVNNTSGRSLSQLLEAGEIDAVLGAITPESYGRNPMVRRLFPDFQDVERQYYRRTRVFPIMHSIVIRREVHEKHPGLSPALWKAFNASKRVAIERFMDVGSLQYMLPWLARDVEEIATEFDGDAFPYGLEASRPTLEALTRYLHQQGLTAKKMNIDDLFARVDLAAG